MSLDIQDSATTQETAAPTTHQGILDFVSEVAAMTTDDEWLLP